MDSSKKVSLVKVLHSPKLVCKQANLSSHPATTKTGTPKAFCALSQSSCWEESPKLIMDDPFLGSFGLYLYSTKQRAPGPE